MTFPKAIRGGIRGADLTILEIQHAPVDPECKPNSALVWDDNLSLLMTSHERPSEIFDQTPVPHVREALVPGKPEIVFVVPRHGIHFFAGHARYGHKPPVFEIGKSMSRKHPDSLARVLKQRLCEIVGQSTRLMKDCGFSIPQSVQPIASG